MKKLGLVALIFALIAGVLAIISHENELQEKWDQLPEKEQQVRQQMKEQLVSLTTDQPGTIFITVKDGNNTWTGVVNDISHSGVRVLYPGPDSRADSTQFIPYGHPVRHLGSFEVTNVLTPDDPGWDATARWYYLQ